MRSDVDLDSVALDGQRLGVLVVEIRGLGRGDRAKGSQSDHRSATLGFQQADAKADNPIALKFFIMEVKEFRVFN